MKSSLLVLQPCFSLCSHNHTWSLIPSLLRSNRPIQFLYLFSCYLHCGHLILEDDIYCLVQVLLFCLIGNCQNMLAFRERLWGPYCTRRFGNEFGIDLHIFANYFIASSNHWNAMEKYSISIFGTVLWFLTYPCADFIYFPQKCNILLKMVLDTIQNKHSFDFPSFIIFLKR